MFANGALFLALALQQIVVPLGHPPVRERERAPIAESGPAWARSCKEDDAWDAPAPPVRIHGNTYLVGTCGISAILIVGDDGDILIDGGPEKAADLIADNIRALDFKLSDVRILLNSHEHFDHVGGIARLQDLTGATLMASAPAAAVFASGRPSADDPQAGILKPFPPARVGRIIRDGQQVRLGNLMLTAIATPGHTAGGLSWRWESCDGGVCRTMVYADSLSPVSRDGYRFTDHPVLVATFRTSIAKIAAGRCEILLTPHPMASGMRARIGAGKTLLDTDGCRVFAAAKTKALDDRLAKEAAH
ncbi:MAG: subclass B3 metallo-beta-lactamase [Sphingomicrobium sp.]